MPAKIRAAGVLTVFAAVAVVVLTQQAASAAGARATSPVHRHARSCAVASAGEASCNAIVRTDLAPNATPSGFGPADLQSAYALPSSTNGSGKTIAIVDAFDDPTAEADLGVYRTQFGLPACTTANGCFRKVNQTGGTKYPRVNGGWAQEISLDLDMASAICPLCKILLVEASSASFANLGAAENEAATLGATVISNSYGGSDAADTTYGHFYNHPGIAITVSSGDAGFGVQYPASSQYVTAVGGTHLVRSSTTRGWTETVWSGAGSGCSTLNPALSGQASFSTGCAKRAVADVSAVADPNTGVAVYDSTRSGGLSGWLVFGGTSVAAPVIAGVYALSSNTTGGPNTPYSNYTGNFNDVTSGSNGTCSPTQLCTARTGWDGPTGLGTPKGVGGF